MGEEEAKRRGISEITNHLFGYDSISASKEQIVSAYTKSPTTFVIECTGPDEARRQKWSMLATKHFNEAINRSRRFRPVHESVGGDATLVGSAFYCHLDPYDWCPRSRRPLVPRESGVLPEDVPYACIPDRVSLADLYRYLDIAKRQQGKSGESWNMKGLKDAIRFLENNTGIQANSTSTTASRETYEEIEYAEQSGAISPSSYRASIPVFYVITARSDEDGTPSDVTMLARHTDVYRGRRAKEGDPVECLLFDRERAFKTPSDWLNPLFLDCSVGGEVSWHRTMGLGRLNYDSDVDVEEFFNDAMQGSKEQVRRLFKVKNGADMDLVERWATGEEFSNLVPDGVEIMEQGKSANFQYAFNTMGMLQQASRKNGNMALSNSGGMEKQVKELEVQALERQGRNAMAISNRIDNVYFALEGVGCRMLKTFLSPSISKGDKGYPEVAYFRYCLERDGVPIEFLREKNKYGFVNFKLRVNRVAGDGDKVREAMVNRMLLQWLHLFSPQAQQVIVRRVVATETNDYQLSEELVPFQQEPDYKQQERAANESQTMLQRSGTGWVAPVKPDDIAGIHIPEHMQDLAAAVTRGQQGQWNQFISAGVQAIAKHVMAHMPNMQSNPDLQKQYIQQLQQIGQIVQQLDRQEQQKQEQSQVDPVDAATLQLKQAQLQQKQIEFGALDAHRTNSLGLSVQKEANRSAEANVRLARENNSAAYADLAKEQEIAASKAESILAGRGNGKTTKANR